MHDPKERRDGTRERVALRRIATLVAEGAQPGELFAVVAEEVGRVVEAPEVAVGRYEPDDAVTVCGTFPARGALFNTGAHVPLQGSNVLRRVRDHAAPARVDDYASLRGDIADAVRDRGLSCSVGVPIVVAGQVWGAIVASSTDRLPEDTEARLADFTELLAAAIADTAAREALARLADEQTALRRLAILVARRAPTDELFGALVEEVARLLPVNTAALGRYEPDGLVTTVAAWSDVETALPIGRRWLLEGESVTALVFRTGGAARIDDFSTVSGGLGDRARPVGYRSAVGCPITVDGRLWGVIATASVAEEPLPPDTEQRLETFTELVTTAISNSESRAALERLADEQAALRRVATLVAEDAAPARIFSAVCEEVEQLFRLSVDPTAVAGVIKFERDEFVLVGLSRNIEVPLGSRWGPKELYASTRALRSGRPARVGPGDLASVGGPDAEFLRLHGYLSQVASPIVVEGRPWGVITMNAAEELPADTEERLESFTGLVATAIANAESRETRIQLADEQAALRRVATLVAKEHVPEAVFAMVAEETGRLLGGVECTLLRNEGDGTATNVGTWGADVLAVFPLGAGFTPDGDGVAATVLRTGRPHRIDDYSAIEDPVARSARDRGIESSVGCPILVRGAIWGAIVVGANGTEPFPPETETRLTQFADLVATAVANAEAGREIARLAEEQAALRRVATLIARDASPDEVFAAVAMEVGNLLDTDITVVGRYDGDGTATAIGSWSSAPGGVPVGTRSLIGGHNVLTLVAETARPARVEGYDDASGDAAEIARRHGWRSSIAAPIIVESRLWGVMLVATQRAEPFPTGAEERLAAFTDLVATALANAQAHDEVQRFGEEQAALGRVATLVAAGAAPEQVFTAVVDEVSSLLGLERIELVHYDGEASGTVIASSGEHPFPAGTTWSLDDPSVMATVARTRRAARIDDYGSLKGEIADAARGAGFRSAIGAPVTVDGRLWGVIIAISTDPAPIPERSEARLGQFTELVATAVANADARDALAQIADEQAALRRVATLVAEGVEPNAIFSAVGEEIARLFGSSLATVGRFEPGAQALVAVGLGSGNKGIPLGSRWELDDLVASGQVFRTGRSARVDEVDWSAVRGPLAPIGRRLGIASTVASPIFVDGRLWGAVSVSDDKPLPAAAEARLEKFAELIATAIANAESSAELAASRRRIVAAADEARRRIERDLHDGIQQRLIALGFRARALARRPQDELPGIATELSEGLREVSDELREISRGIHPTVLTEAGLGPALRALARRSGVPIDVDVVLDERLPAPVEAAAYYIASEALTNVAKHAHANVVQLTAAHAEGTLALEVRDDGVGGVDTTHGSGILGLVDRVDALGGTLSITSPPGGGTTLSVRLPTTA